MKSNSIAKIFCKPLAITTILFVAIDILLVNYDYFELLEKYDDGILYLNLYHSFILFLFISWCISEFTQDYTISFVISAFISSDKQLALMASDRTSLTGEDSPLWSQYFFFFSVFVAPILSRAIMLNDYPIIQLIFVGILAILLSFLSIFSLYMTFVPQAIIICTLISKFIHIDSSKTYRFIKKDLLIAFKILLFLTICELCYPKYTDIYSFLCNNKYSNIIMKYLTAHRFDDFPAKTIIASNDLNYFNRLGQFFADDNEFQIVIIGYALSSIFYQKIKQHYENCFVIIAILSLLIPSYEDPHSDPYAIHFFIFKTYLLIAFGISCSRIKVYHFVIIISLILFALCLRNYDIGY